MQDYFIGFECGFEYVVDLARSLDNNFNCNFLGRYPKGGDYLLRCDSGKLGFELAKSMFDFGIEFGQNQK